ncbi:DUF2790 domain-containing protein [Pseudomonas sp. efr-133-TYG-103a]|uniref:DUF2790 domain-containing protein n=1 Tax=Pseudomonas sp. efr-133-TYG-103a TaxID=3040308 RepID=UPI002557119B|nr:DUF2790 domain-containing protein [Pseudomonas sp. efr-133-TYG-103a]
MKPLLFLLLSGLASLAVAGEASTQTANVSVEKYSYSQNLDIAHVVAVTQVPNVCKVVPVQLTYDDSKGNWHIMEYQVLGNGCTN